MYNGGFLINQNFSQRVDTIMTGNYPGNYFVVIDLDCSIKDNSIQRSREAKDIFNK